MKEVYLCSEYLRTHPLFKSFGSDLASLAQKDYPGKGYFEGKDIPSIDLDEYERKTKLSNDCTSDGVVGIANVLDSRMTNRRLLLTELRMDYKNQKNLDFSNIRRKYIHSSEILRKYDPEKRIDPEFALVFSNSTAPKARRWINNWAKEASRRDAANWKACDPESFCNHINYGKELPLHPTQETLSLVEGWCSKCVTGYNELSKLKESVEMYWAKLITRYLLPDMQYVSTKVSAYLDGLSVPRGDDGELFLLEKNEIEQIIRICDK
ncbi:MAG: hypothetical protein K2M16_08995 [Muribaculaceae bacterium]|nr:hypothetical protein [Muribaculaceae bacterium]